MNSTSSPTSTAVSTSSSKTSLYRNELLNGDFAAIDIEYYKNDEWNLVPFEDILDYWKCIPHKLISELNVYFPTEISNLILETIGLPRVILNTMIFAFYGLKIFLLIFSDSRDIITMIIMLLIEIVYLKT